MHGSGSTVPMSRIAKRPLLHVSLLSEYHTRIAKDEGEVVAMMELFGGAGETSYILAKYHALKSGMNFDVTAGFNLQDDSDRTLVQDYVRRHKPLVAIMAPPCGSFGSLQALNRVINPDTWAMSREVGEKLTEIACQIAKTQCEEGRPFFGGTASGKHHV